MFLDSFQMIPQSVLGVDIGTSSIKLVEISRWGNRNKLENYGEIGAEILYEKPFLKFEKSTLAMSTYDIARGIQAIMEETKVKTRRVYFSIPDFSSFFTWFELPPMTKEEIPQAVSYEARRHIPLPLSEITLDWQIIGGAAHGKQKSPFKILLVAVPNEVINQYQSIASLAKLELRALEAEVFGLTRSLFVGGGSEVTILIDIGARSTTISMIEKGSLKMTHSFDMAGNEFTEVLSRSLGVDYKTAEKLKKEHGMIDSNGKSNIREALSPLVDLIVSEIEKISKNYYQREKKEAQKVILSGGSALLPGIDRYISQRIQKPVSVDNPFSTLFYPPILEETLKGMGPSYAISVGMALRGLE